MSDIVSERNILGISPTVADPNTNIHDQAAALSNDFEVTEGADNQEPTLWMTQHMTPPAKTGVIQDLSGADLATMQAASHSHSHNPHDGFPEYPQPRTTKAESEAKRDIQRRRRREKTLMQESQKQRALRIELRQTNDFARKEKILKEMDEIAESIAGVNRALERSDAVERARGSL